MKFYTRKLIKPEDLNPRNTLFGGALLRWIDEEASIFAMSALESTHVVTKFISEIDFVHSAHLGSIIEIGLSIVKVGTSSLTLKCIVRDIFTKKTIVSIDKMVFVRVDSKGLSKAHGKSLDEIKINVAK